MKCWRRRDAPYAAPTAKRKRSGIGCNVDWGYLRLRKPNYPDTELQDWARKITSKNWQTDLAFFKHEEAGAAPKLAGGFSCFVESLLLFLPFGQDGVNGLRHIVTRLFVLQGYAYSG
jgi:hypothetical protein